MTKCGICKWRHAWDCEDFREYGNPANCKQFELDESRLTEEEARQYAIIMAAFEKAVQNERPD